MVRFQELKTFEGIFANVANPKWTDFPCMRDRVAKVKAALVKLKPTTLIADELKKLHLPESTNPFPLEDTRQKVAHAQIVIERLVRIEKIFANLSDLDFEVNPSFEERFNELGRVYHLLKKWRVTASDFRNRQRSPWGISSHLLIVTVGKWAAH